MFDIPEKYKVGLEIAMKDFIPKDIKPNDKQRIMKAVKRAELTYQIQGEEIPSVVNDDYNCTVIQFYEIELTSIKEAVFVANIYQQMIKNLCVLRLYDVAKEKFSFGLKRLSKIEENKVVLEDSFISNEFLLMLPDKKKKMFLKYTSYNNILNKTTKISFYQELFTKEKIILNYELIPEIELMLEKPIWYDFKKMCNLNIRIGTIVELIDKKKKENISAEQMLINQEIKKNIMYIREVIGG